MRPRQHLTAAPFASYATNTSWSGIAGVPEGLGDGVDDDTLGSLGCSAGEIARWNGSNWECTVDLVGEGPGWSLTGNAGGAGSGPTTADMLFSEPSAWPMVAS